MIGGNVIMFVCVECGHLFDEDDIASWREYRGECFGYDAYEEMCGSPCCHANFVEAKVCSCCEGYITDRYVATGDDRYYCSECYCERGIEDDEYL